MEAHRVVQASKNASEMLGMPVHRDRQTLEAVYPRLRAFVDAIGATHPVQDIADQTVRE